MVSEGMYCIVTGGSQGIGEASSRPSSLAFFAHPPKSPHERLYCLPIRRSPSTRSDRGGSGTAPSHRPSVPRLRDHRRRPDRRDAPSLATRAGRQPVGHVRGLSRDLPKDGGSALGKQRDHFHHALQARTARLWRLQRFKGRHGAFAGVLAMEVANARVNVIAPGNITGTAPLSVNLGWGSG